MWKWFPIARMERVVREMGVDVDWPVKCRRVVFVAYQTPELGGGGTFIDTMSQAFTEAGLDVEHVSIERGVRPPRFRTTTIHRWENLHNRAVLRSQTTLVTRLKALPLLLVKRLDRWVSDRAFRRLIAGRRDDTVVIFTDGKAKIQLDNTGFARSVGGPVLIGQHHSNFTLLNQGAKDELRVHYADLDAFVGLSQQDADEVHALIGIPSFRISNPVPPVRPSGADREDEAVALVRLSPEKQLGIMIRAFASAKSRAELVNWSLKIYGAGPERGSLESLIAELGAGEWIHLMGRTDNVGVVLSRAKLNLLSSSIEGFPMSILEAAACGVPTLTFDCSPGVRELVTSDTGYLVPAGDEEAYGEVLRCALEDRSELSRRGREAQLHVRTYSSERIVEEWGRVISRCYEARGVDL